VITGEEIRRGGFSSIPDALRMVPGLHVAQQNAHVWLVSSRGFSSLFNAQMLVLRGCGGTCRTLRLTTLTASR
jgi:iron complex outermembrane receptor protein